MLINRGESTQFISTVTPSLNCIIIHYYRPYWKGGCQAPPTTTFKLHGKLKHMLDRLRMNTWDFKLLKKGVAGKVFVQSKLTGIVIFQ